MKPFYRGLIFGYLFKEHINNLVKFIGFNGLNLIYKIKSGEYSRFNNGINKINLVLKITNEELFNETFDQKFQKWWKYFPEKKVLKIELDQELINYLNKTEFINFDDLLDALDSNDDHIITLDIPLFKTMGDIYLYITYYVDSRKFINVYTLNSIISKDDFKLINSPIEYENIICSSVKHGNNKTEYLTNYLKLFYNNKCKLSPELVLLNYDKLTQDVKNSSLVIVKDKCIREYSYTEMIN
jgi:hypothetical protein